MTGLIPQPHETEIVRRASEQAAREFVEFCRECYPHFWSKAPDNIEQKLAGLMAHALVEHLR